MFHFNLRSIKRHRILYNFNKCLRIRREMCGMCYLCNSIACFPNFLPQWSSCYFHVFSVTPCRGFVFSVFQDTVISADDILSRHTLGKIISKQEKYSSGKRNMLTQKALRIAAKCSPCEKGWSQADMWTIIVCSNTRWAFKVKMETGLKTAWNFCLLAAGKCMRFPMEHTFIHPIWHRVSALLCL